MPADLGMAGQHIHQFALAGECLTAQVVHQVVRDLAADVRTQAHHHGLGHHQATGHVDVGAHALGIHLEAGQHEFGLLQRA